MKELRSLHTEVSNTIRATSFYQEEGSVIFLAGHIVRSAFDYAEMPVDFKKAYPLIDLTLELLYQDGIWEPLDVDWSNPLSAEEAMSLRRMLRVQKKVFSRDTGYIQTWADKLMYLYAGILGYIRWAGPEGNGKDNSLAFRISLHEAIDNLPEVIERIMITLEDNDVVNAELFSDVREQLRANLLRASGIDQHGQYGANKSVVFPTDSKEATSTGLLDAYVHGTPFLNYFHYKEQLTIPDTIRFEHTHIVGGTGHGKTQLLQYLLCHDLKRASRGECGICVIDSQGDLIRKLSHLAEFSPDHPNSLAEKILLINPDDIEYPASLNMFDLHLDRVQELDAATREKILNGTIELYEYMFGALLGAELTHRQDVIFRFLVRLMMSIPDATVHTLRELMEDATPFQKHIDKLDGITRTFFETQFHSGQYNQTKKQILTRLWGILSNAALERMFASKRNKVDMLQAMNEGKIVLINTSKDLLKADGCQILGRFFIAQIAQAVMERSALPESDRLPFMVYIDEAQEYFDEHIEVILTQARKYNVAIHMAHQSLVQLPSHLKGIMMTNTSVKMAGGVSAKDANDLAAEMHTSPDYVREAQKYDEYTEFALWLKNVTSGSMRVPIPFGVLEKKETLTNGEYQNLLQRNRETYCSPLVVTEGKKQEELADAEPPTDVATQSVDSVSTESKSEAPHPTQEEEPTAQKPSQKKKRKRSKKSKDIPVAVPAMTQGKGGSQHRYLQNLIKKISEERGYGAKIEEQVLGGAGSVDIALARGDERIAIEVSVSTDSEHELANIRKCLSAGYDFVVSLGGDAKTARKHQRYCAAEIEEEFLHKVRFFVPDEFIQFLDERAASSVSKEDEIIGYKVKVNFAALSEKDKKQRREAVAKVIVQSMRGLNQG
ncbi:MAG: hypothetical protein AAF434_01595 [Pseudomonadota bacterium]